jgi:hypothetical protein
MSRLERIRTIPVVYGGNRAGPFLRRCPPSFAALAYKTHGLRYEGDLSKMSVYSPRRFRWVYDEKGSPLVRVPAAMLSNPMRPDDELLRLGVEKLHAIVGGAPASAARRLGGPYCFWPGGMASFVRSGGEGASSAGAEPLSSDAAVQSPAQILVPLTVPTSLQPVGSFGFAWCTDLLPTLGGAF